MATRNATVLPALVTLLLMAGPACAQEVGNAQQGKIVYEKYCVLCHGEQGDEIAFLLLRLFQHTLAEESSKIVLFF